MTSAFKVCAPLGVSTSTVTPSAPFVTLPVFDPVRISIPRVFRLRARTADDSSSSPGKIRSSSSTTVTLVPIAL